MAKAPKKGKGGLGKWFGEEWTDVKTGKACGRKSAKGKSKRPYPACRPKKVASKITKSEATKKTGPKRENGLLLLVVRRGLNNGYSRT